MNRTISVVCSPFSMKIKFFFQWMGMVVWFLICSFLGTLLAIVRWGNTNNNRIASNIYGWLILKIFGIQLDVEGIEHLDSTQPRVYVANHQSGLDLATFGSIFPKNTLLIGKKQLAWVPIFGLYFMAAGNILIHREKRTKAVQSLAEAVRAIRERKVSIWIFPEGTRSGGRGMLPFKRGAFYLAVQAGVPIVPLVCEPLSPFFDWKKKEAHSGRLRIRILPPIDIREFGEAKETNKMDSLVEKVRSEMEKAFKLI